MKFARCSAKGVSALVRIAAVSAAFTLLLSVGAAAAPGQLPNADVRDPGVGPLIAQVESPSASLLEAQQEPSTPDARRAEAEQELKQEKQQRMLGVVPDFYSVRSGHAVPLSPGQKFHLALADIFDPFDFASSAADAGLEQQQGEFPEYGSGWAGFAKRFGAAYADDADGELLSEGVLPSLLHQDPRYFRLGRGGVGRRLGYSLLTAVRCLGDDGKWQFNASGIVGTFAAGAISNAYYPSADRGLGLTLQRGSIDIGESLIQSLASEFYPDISRTLFHQRPKPATAPVP